MLKLKPKGKTSLIFRMTKEQKEYLRLAKEKMLGLSYQRYMAHVLFPPGWKREYQKLRDEETPE